LNAPRPKTGRARVALGLGAALLFLAGMAARGALSSSPSSRPPAAFAVDDPGPRRAAAGMPVGFAHSERGALAAALTYTTIVPQRALYLRRDEVNAAVDAIAAPGASDSLRAQVLADFDQVQPRLAVSPTTTWWTVTALAAHTDAFTADRARLSVWVLRVLSKQGVVAPQSSWATVTVELVWANDDWRLWSQTTTPGPTPTLDASDAPATAAGLDARLAGFTLVDSAPR
jgi:hypothetical protein